VNGPCYVLAVDHRKAMVDPCRERGIDLRRLGAFKKLVVAAMAEVAVERPDLAGRVMVLVDGQYGSDALALAAEHGIEVGEPVEEGGVVPLRFYRPDWEAAIVGRRPAFIKVRFNGGPLQDFAQRREQESNVVRISRACESQGVAFVPEPLLDPRPKSMDDRQRAEAMVEWLGNLRSQGVKARFWKLEGFVDPAAAETLARSLPEGEDVLLLGGTTPREHLAECFRTARRFTKYQGFSVGRHIFWEAYLEYLRDPCTPGLAAALGARYLDTVDLWEGAGT
jgi:5-dehydro-2-deoxygluconokinase